MEAFLKTVEAGAKRMMESTQKDLLLKFAAHMGFEATEEQVTAFLKGAKPKAEKKKATGGALQWRGFASKYRKEHGAAFKEDWKDEAFRKAWEKKHDKDGESEDKQWHHAFATEIGWAYKHATLSDDEKGELKRLGAVKSSKKKKKSSGKKKGYSGLEVYQGFLVEYKMGDTEKGAHARGQAEWKKVKDTIDEDRRLELVEIYRENQRLKAEEKAKKKSKKKSKAKKGSKGKKEIVADSDDDVEVNSDSD
jgi:hypothetical protein